MKQADIQDGLGKEQTMRIIDADSIDWSVVEDEHGKRSESIVDCEILIENQTTIETKEIKYFDEDDSVWKIGRVIVDE